MTADPFDPRSLWQDQTPEEDPMTLEQIHDLARRRERRTRFTLPLMGVILGAALFVYGEQFQTAKDAFQRIAVLVSAAGLLAFCWLMYRVVFPRRDPAEPAGAYLRRQLELGLRNHRGGWMMAIAPLLPGFLLTYVARALRGQAGHGPLLTSLLPLMLVVAAFVLAMFRARRAAPRIQAEIDELDRLIRR
jgi:hypothetical protein